MKFARMGEAGRERPAVIDDAGVARDLSAVVTDIDGDFLARGGQALLDGLDLTTLPVIEGSLRYGPVLARPGKIICVGLNYTDHAAEVGLPVPEEPTVFIKACAPTGANDPIVLPKDAQKADWEVELAIVIGTAGMYISEADALRHVAGYCLIHDFTERSYQMERSGQWTKGKSFPGFAPLGPWLVTRDELGAADNLGIWLEVNGQRRQQSTTGNLVFGVAALVSYLSRFYRLEPGDVIATGTPAGVGLGHRPPIFLRPGDHVRLGIDGLGVQQQTLHAWPDSP